MKTLYLILGIVLLSTSCTRERTQTVALPDPSTDISIGAQPNNPTNGTESKTDSGDTNNPDSSPSSNNPETSGNTPTTRPGTARQKPGSIANNGQNGNTKLGNEGHTGNIKDMQLYGGTILNEMELKEWFDFDNKGEKLKNDLIIPMFKYADPTWAFSVRYPNLIAEEARKRTLLTVEALQQILKNPAKLFKNIKKSPFKNGTCPKEDGVPQDACAKTERPHSEITFDVSYMASQGRTVAQIAGIIAHEIAHQMIPHLLRADGKVHPSDSHNHKNEVYPLAPYFQRRIEKNLHIGKKFSVITSETNLGNEEDIRSFIPGHNCNKDNQDDCASNDIILACGKIQENTRNAMFRLLKNCYPEIAGRMDGYCRSRDYNRADIDKSRYQERVIDVIEIPNYSFYISELNNPKKEMVEIEKSQFDTITSKYERRKKLKRDTKRDKSKFAVYVITEITCLQ